MAEYSAKQVEQQVRLYLAARRDPEAGPDCEQAMERMDLQRAFRALPQLERRVLFACGVYGVSQAVVATQLQMSQPSVSRLYGRALCLLTQALNNK